MVIVCPELTHEVYRPRQRGGWAVPAGVSRVQGCLYELGVLVSFSVAPDE